MDAYSDISEITGSTAQDELDYLKSTFGLDTHTALLLKRAMHLQEKGQLKQAQRYYAAVLDKASNCKFAADNARIVSELLADQEQDTLYAEPIFENAPTPVERASIQVVGSPETVLEESDDDTPRLANVSEDLSLMSLLDSSRGGNGTSVRNMQSSNFDDASENGEDVQQTTTTASAPEINTHSQFDDAVEDDADDYESLCELVALAYSLHM
ncbi:expressed unknown protein [Seminavis robusta]|uniref:Uncharacterized protein n=1 Tax=Seminavis robusta TaxID=568900 RepID=A0A9N8EW29_9STRA|nr:expressed unknown protein [Seminavis robusta]|eukprot:Sro1933_g306230.1 n/a (212) ;mRNA; r:4752-5387